MLAGGDAEEWIAECRRLSGRGRRGWAFNRNELYERTE
jgi:hypothetical protein